MEIREAILTASLSTHLSINVSALVWKCHHYMEPIKKVMFCI